MNSNEEVLFFRSDEYIGWLYAAAALVPLVFIDYFSVPHGLSYFNFILGGLILYGMLGTFPSLLFKRQDTVWIRARDFRVNIHRRRLLLPDSNYTFYASDVTRINFRVMTNEDGSDWLTRVCVNTRRGSFVVSSNRLEKMNKATAIAKSFAKSLHVPYVEDIQR